MNGFQTYSVNVSWTENRKGIIGSEVLDDKIAVAAPPGFSNGISGVWSPEHLFAAAASSCYMTTFLTVADRSKLDFISFYCRGSAILEETGSQLMITQIVLRPVIRIANRHDVNKALKVLEIAHRSCLIFHSIKSKIALLPTVNVALKPDDDDKTNHQNNI